MLTQRKVDISLERINPLVGLLFAGFALWALIRNEVNWAYLNQYLTGFIGADLNYMLWLVACSGGLVAYFLLLLIRSTRRNCARQNPVHLIIIPAIIISTTLAFRFLTSIYYRATFSYLWSGYDASGVFFALLTALFALGSYVTLTLISGTKRILNYNARWRARSAIPKPSIPQKRTVLRNVLLVVSTGLTLYYGGGFLYDAMSANPQVEVFWANLGILFQRYGFDFLPWMLCIGLPGILWAGLLGFAQFRHPMRIIT